ncbi:MAG TPA: hypothetical protein VF875_12355 [Anaeromyxobacter sp.]
MRLGTAALATTLAASLGLLATGCGEVPGAKCGDQTPPVSGAPASCTALAGTKVTVPVRVCPRCDQATPRCLVHTENASGGQITLEPIAEVCDPSTSCPPVDPASCSFQPLDCEFTAPAPGHYQLVVATPGTALDTPLTVLASTDPSPGQQCTY